MGGDGGHSLAHSVASLEETYLKDKSESESPASVGYRGVCDSALGLETPTLPSTLHLCTSSENIPSQGQGLSNLKFVLVGEGICGSHLAGTRGLYIVL